jgi:protein-tyrosine-phosphatase
MRKVVIITGLYALLTTGWLVASCGSANEQQNYAEQQQEATQKAAEVHTDIREAEDTAALVEARDELSESVQKLEKAKKNYLTELQRRQTGLNEKISELDVKVTDPQQPNREKWVEKRQKLIRERDRLQVNLLEVQRPMTDERWTTVEQELKDLIATIDHELADF